MGRHLSALGKALETKRVAAGLDKATVAERMNTTSRHTYDRVARAEKPRVATVLRAANAVCLDEDEALRLAGYDPALVRKTRQQAEQQQQGAQLAG